MSAPAPTPERRSSVLYALGRLESQNEEQRREIQELPDRLAALFNPRLAALEGYRVDHDKRLTTVERRWWILVGITGAATTIISLAEGWTRIHHG